MSVSRGVNWGCKAVQAEGILQVLVGGRERTRLVAAAEFMAVNEGQAGCLIVEVSAKTSTPVGGP
jgi:hypothetical protein